MADKKPNVFPNTGKPQQEQPQTQRQLTDSEKFENFQTEKLQATSDIYSSVKVDTNMDNESYDYVRQNDSLEAMRQRALQEMEIRRQGGVIQYPELAEKPKTRKGSVKTAEDISREKNEEQMRLRDEQLRINQENIERYQVKANEASARNNTNDATNAGLYQGIQQTTQPIMHQNVQGTPNHNIPVSFPSAIQVTQPINYGQSIPTIDPYIMEISQPNYNAPFDVIPLPSEGKLYRDKKANIRVAYMTTADENILTSPNLLKSGQFLEILINRKILEPSLRYKDLHVGDRNAIMIWLRATGYGEMYPISLLDENDELFDVDVNLNNLKTKKLGAEPDEEGLFDFVFPLSRTHIKFKLLTCGDSDAIEKQLEIDKENNYPINNASTYNLEKIIIEVNGDRNKNNIKDFASCIRLRDAKELTDYITSIESGLDMNIEVTTPGGESLATFLPLNFNFFWPNNRL